MGPRVVVTFEDSHSQISALSVFFSWARTPTYTCNSVGLGVTILVIMLPIMAADNEFWNLDEIKSR